MPDLLFAKSRDFTSTEVACYKDCAINGITQEEVYINGYLHGCLQAVRDALSRKFGARFGGLSVTSSNRKAYNHTIKNASSTSYHVWGLRSGNIRCAADLKPVGLTLDQLYEFLIANFKGEIYLNRQQGIVHYAPVGFEDTHWRQ